MQRHLDLVLKTGRDFSLIWYYLLRKTVLLFVVVPDSSLRIKLLLK